MRVKFGVVFEVRLEDKWRAQSRSALLAIIASLIYETIEKNLPEGWAMQVHKMFIDGEEVEE